MSQELRSQAMEAIEWRLRYPAFGKLRSFFEGPTADADEAEFIIQHFMDRIEQGDMITEREWILSGAFARVPEETEEVEA